MASSDTSPHVIVLLLKVSCWVHTTNRLRIHAAASLCSAASWLTLEKAHAHFQVLAGRLQKHLCRNSVQAPIYCPEINRSVKLCALHLWSRIRRVGIESTRWSHEGWDGRDLFTEFNFEWKKLIHLDQHGHYPPPLTNILLWCVDSLIAWWAFILAHWLEKPHRCLQVTNELWEVKGSAGRSLHHTESRSGWRPISAEWDAIKTSAGFLQSNWARGSLVRPPAATLHPFPWSSSSSCCRSRGSPDCMLSRSTQRVGVKEVFFPFPEFLQTHTHTHTQILQWQPSSSAQKRERAGDTRRILPTEPVYLQQRQQRSSAQGRWGLMCLMGSKAWSDWDVFMLIRSWCY